MVSLRVSPLNPDQHEAVTIGGGPVLVLAGAGSGKTRVIVHRIEYLLNALHVPASGIVALTFTNKAAEEMKIRVRQLTGEERARGLTVSTFHSLCTRILRRDIHHLKRKNTFTIYDASEQIGLLRTVAREMNFDNQTYDLKKVAALISSAKNALMEPSRYSQDHDDGYEFITKKIYEKYETALVRYNALDFDDLLVYTIRLFRKHGSCRKSYQKMFKHILVDEYQDTNELQYTILKLLCGPEKNIFVVGDDDQSIYEWRGARPDNLFRFEKDFPGTRIITLDRNYRSTNTILKAANAVISKIEKRKVKNLWSRNGRGEKIVLFHCDDEQDEAGKIVDDIIRKKLEKKCKYSDFSIFYRTNYQSRVIEEALRMRRVPYSVLGGIKFYDRKEVQDIHAYLKLFINERDDNSLLRIINYPHRGIGDRTVMVFDNYAQSKKISLYKSLSSAQSLSDLQPAARNNVEAFVGMIEKYRGLSARPGLFKTVRSLVEETGFRDQLLKDSKSPTEFGHRWENVLEVINAIEHFETFEGQGLKEYLDRISLFSDTDNDKNEMLEKIDTVKLITLHGAKGLEFPHVYIAGLEEDILPHSRSAGQDNSVQEERRLFYVGITRARKSLTLSHAGQRRKYGKVYNRTPSRFLEDIPATLFDQVTEQEPDSGESDRAVAKEYLARIKEMLK